MEPGTVLLRLDLSLRAVPWKAPMVGRHGTYKPKRLRQWQATVAQYARLKWGNHEPYDGPVEVNCRFEFTNGKIPDSTNLLKAIEDSIEGVVIVNDRQAIRNKVERVINSDSDKTMIEVITA